MNSVPQLPASQNISPIKPMSAIFSRGGPRYGFHTTPNRGLTTANRDLTAPDRGLTATKRGELHH